MKTTAIIISFGAVVLCLISPFSFGNVFAVWDFGPSSAFYTTDPASYALPDKPTFVMTGGDIDVNGKNGVDFTDADGVFHAAGQGAAWDDVNKSGADNDAALTITMNTTGWTLLGLRWDYRSEEAVSFDIDYRLSETATWISLLNNQRITADDAFHAVTIDLSPYVVLSDQPFVQFLISDLDEGDGNNRYIFDNLQFTGVPEPATLSLLLLGTAMGLRRRPS
ncbi:MAG: PEP-CTERM sorting domain-containing protein [Phycisphaerae bacterium]|nr:PEP-CTERM sorting domain-containing protein [Phycisphaerae bacterium]